MISTHGKVLVIEDNRDALSGMVALLSTAGFEVRMAPDGDQALNVLDGDFHPDVVVMDLMMPKVSGWQILKHLQGDTNLRNIAVVVVTALDPESAHVVGADVVLRKPINPRELIATVGRLCGKDASVPK